MQGRGRSEGLSRKLKKGELTPKEIIEILDERGLKEGRNWRYVAGGIIWAILCFLPAVVNFSNLDVLSFFIQLPMIEFPAVAVYSAIILIVCGSCMEIYTGYWRIKKGGTRSEDDTIVLIKNGPYGIIRHPECVIGGINLNAIPIAISGYVPFTILSIVGEIVLIATICYGALVEERELSLKKWGAEYRQYMKEVPRFNFILGIWRLAKRKRK